MHSDKSVTATENMVRALTPNPKVAADLLIELIEGRADAETLANRDPATVLKTVCAAYVALSHPGLPAHHAIDLRRALERLEHPARALVPDLAQPLYRSGSALPDRYLACEALHLLGTNDAMLLRGLAVTLAPSLDLSRKDPNDYKSCARALLSSRNHGDLDGFSANASGAVLAFTNPNDWKDLRELALARLISLEPVRLVAAPEVWFALGDHAYRAGYVDGGPRSPDTEAFMRWAKENLFTLELARELRNCQRRGWSQSQFEVVRLLQNSDWKPLQIRAALIQNVSALSTADLETRIRLEAECAVLMHQNGSVIESQCLCTRWSEDLIRYAAGYASVRTVDEAIAYAAQPFPIRHLAIGAAASGHSANYGRPHAHNEYLKALELQNLAATRRGIIELRESFGDFTQSDDAVLPEIEVNVPEEPHETEPQSVVNVVREMAGSAAYRMIEELSIDANSIAAIDSADLPRLNALTVAYPGHTGNAPSWIGQIEKLTLLNGTALRTFAPGCDLSTVREVDLSDVDDCAVATQALRQSGILEPTSIRLRRYPLASEVPALLSQPGLTALAVPLTVKDHEPLGEKVRVCPEITELHLSMDDTAVLAEWSTIQWPALRRVTFETKTGSIEPIRRFLESLAPGQLETCHVSGTTFSTDELASLLGLPSLGALRDLGLGGRQSLDVLRALDRSKPLPSVCSLSLSGPNTESHKGVAELQRRVFDRWIDQPVVRVEINFPMVEEISHQVAESGLMNLPIGGATYRACCSRYVLGPNKSRVMYFERLSERS